VKYRVTLTAHAEQDVENALKWFHDQSATAAGRRWFAQLMKRIATLESRPTRCAKASEADDLGEEIRELLFGHRRAAYRILFHIRETTVEILHVRHAARDALSTEDM
jgi:plasmid stabilization system protein ParE